MELALIPPICLLAEDNSNYHLMLPHLLRDERYAKHFWDMQELVVGTSYKKDYIILDNGVAEDEVFPMDALHIIAAQYDVDCIVMPDVYMSAMGTYENYLQYKKYFARDEEVAGIGRMYVCHGRSSTEVMSFIDEVAKDNFTTHIGVPRILAHTIGNGEITRVQIADKILNAYGDRFKIHFLGMHPLFPMEGQLLASTYKDEPRVQGMDTSLPFNAAFHNVYIDGPNLNMLGSITRPDGYFDLPVDAFHPETDALEHNINLMRSWVS